MEGIKVGIDLIVSVLRYPLFGVISGYHIIIGFAVFEVAIVVWRYFSSKLGY